MNPHPSTTKQKAQQLRKQGKFLDEIVNATGAPRSTVYGWIRDIRFQGKSKRACEARKLGSLRMQAKYAAKRQEDYEATDLQMLREPLIRDFIVMYLAEGYRRNRNVVHICNSNPIIMKMSLDALRRLGLSRIPNFKLKLYPDHNEKDKTAFWARFVGIEPEQIQLWKDKSKQKPSKYRRSEHGILYMWVGNTVLRTRLQALMDAVENEWVPFCSRSSVEERLPPKEKAVGSNPSENTTSL